MYLTEVRSIQDDTELVGMMADYVSKNENKVCSTCGLQVMGHYPQSQWLGYDAHEFAPKVASAEDIARSRELSSKSYQMREEQA